MPLHKNPILNGFNPDPSIVRVGDDFFLVTSTFEYFPGLPIYHSSKDLISWKLIGHALTRPSQLNLRTVEPGSGIWAPTIRYHDGTFYITSALWTAYCPQQNVRVWPRGFHVSTTDIWNDSSWSDPAYFDQPGFDQDLFWDHDGRAYLSTCFRTIDHDTKSGLKGFAVHVSEVDLATGTSLGPQHVVRKSPSGVAEGSHIFKKGPYYYLFTAEGGTESGHSEWVFRSREGPFGPWETGPKNPLLSSTTGDDIQNTGHADLVEDLDGNWWAVCLAVRPHRICGSSNHSTFVPSPFGRETFLMRVHWEDDWPVFNQGQKLDLSFEAKQTPRSEGVDWVANFEDRKLALGWYNKNTPLKKEHSLTDRIGHLRLWGGPYDLQSLESPTMLLRKQTHATGTWKTLLSFNPASTAFEAGIVLYWNCYTFASIGIRKAYYGSHCDRELLVTRPGSSPGEFVHSSHPLHHEGSVSLAIACTPTHYRLGFSEEPELNEHEWVGDDIPMEVMTVDPPRGMAFTGMMFGLYAFGELQKCLSPADFSFASFTAA